MNSLRIKQLLDRASELPRSDVQETAQIQSELSDAVFDGDERGDGIKVLMETLFVKMLQNRPELLPTMSPVFVLMCGDRDKKNILGEIDWSLIE